MAEEKQLRKKQKKIKKKKEITIAAEIEVKKFTEERNIKEEMGTAYSDPLVNENSYTCPHVPQCILRGPRPPPIGPRTLKQSETDKELFKNEAVQIFMDHVRKFMKQEPGETLDDTVAKLEALKRMFEPVSDPETEESEFDDLIKLVKSTKEAIETLQNSEDEYDEEYFEGLVDDDLPRHYWGGDDGNELIFEDDSNF